MTTSIFAWDEKMLNTRFTALITGCLFVCSPLLHADDIVFEDFEDSIITYTTSVSDDLSDIAASDYFGRIAPDTATPPADISYNSALGSGYYGVQDSDGTASGNIDALTLDLVGISIADYENLALTFFIAEDDASDGNEDWDTASSFRAEYQIDGGGFQDFFAVESELVGGTDQTNERPLVDTNFDTFGDGAEITDTFTQYGGLIGATGSTIDIRFSFDFLDTGDEDIALDNIRLSGDFVGVPEPGSLSILLAISGLLVVRRRK